MKNDKRKKHITATGIGCILALFGILFLPGLFLNTNGSGSGEFHYYRGPVLPMTSLNGADGIDVLRNVNFDFATYAGREPYHAVLKEGGAGITDTYTLANISGESKSLELVYGFQASFIDEPEEFPVIRIDGESIQPKLYPSVDQPESLRHAANFENYSQILTEQDYLGTALRKSEKLNIPVTVYHFTDLAYQGTEVAGYPMLTLQYTVDENTRVWTLGADSLSEDFLMFRVDRGEAWVYTIGGTLIEPKFGGNKDYNVNENSAVDGVTFQQEIYEATLEDVIRQTAQNYDFWAIEGHQSYPNPGYVTPEILMDGAIKRFPAENDIVPYGVVQTIDGLFYEVITEPRMMYLVFPVTLEAGQSVTVEVSYTQEPSFDNGGPKKYREGYDMATRLASNLTFNGLSASLSHTDFIELGEQNFGFNLDKGVTEVNLDLNVERYYLEVKIKK